jgi:hypothetical protein
LSGRISSREPSESRHRRASVRVELDILDRRRLQRHRVGGGPVRVLGGQPPPGLAGTADLDLHDTGSGNAGLEDLGLEVR